MKTYGAKKTRLPELTTGPSMEDSVEKKPSRFWVWVFTNIDGLLWVLEHNAMAFPSEARSRAASIGRGDQAILYLSAAAFGDAIGISSRLVGIVRVSTQAPERRPVRIGKRNYTWAVDFKKEFILEEMDGPPVKGLVHKLELVKQPENWGQYFRGSPIEIPEGDFRLMEQAIKGWTTGPR